MTGPARRDDEDLVDGPAAGAASSSASGGLSTFGLSDRSAQDLQVSDGSGRTPKVRPRPEEALAAACDASGPDTLGLPLVPTVELGEMIAYVCGAVRQRDTLIIKQAARLDRLTVVVRTLLEVAKRDGRLDPSLLAPCCALEPGDLALSTQVHSASTEGP